MKINDLKKLRDRTPFSAFRLHLNNGDTLPVPHPDYVALPPETKTELFVVWVGVQWNLVDAGQIARVSLLSQGNSNSKSKS